MHRFINQYSGKTFLSKVAKDLTFTDDFMSWKIQGRQQVICAQEITENNIETLTNFLPTNMFYLTPPEFDLIKSKFKIANKTKENNVVVDLEQLTFSGKHHKDIRNYINRCKNLNLSIESELKKPEDLRVMVARWSETLGEKYFQDRSGKNVFFIESNFHKDCHNIFIYDQDRLIAFAILSPVEDEHCSYIIGKTLCKDYPGITEYCDFVAFETAVLAGAKKISLGGGSPNLIKYKLKFQGAIAEPNFNIKITEKKV